MQLLVSNKADSMQKLESTPSLRRHRERTTLKAESFLDGSVLQVNYCVVYIQRAFCWPEQE